MPPEKKGPPQKELALKPFIFSFTTVIEKRLEEMGVTPEEAAFFCKPLDGFLKAATDYLPMGLVGLALTTELEKNERLPLITVITYWDKPVGGINPPTEIGKFLENWKDPLVPDDPDEDYIPNLIGLIGNTSRFPTYEAFLDHLMKNAPVGFTGAPQKFLGSVSVPELRQELRDF